MIERIRCVKHSFELKHGHAYLCKLVMQIANVALSKVSEVPAAFEEGGGALSMDGAAATLGTRRLSDSYVQVTDRLFRI